MHAGGRIAAVLLLTMLFAPAVLAESWAYGGRGEDRLLEITEADGGLFAVGMTASADGDLSMRTRTGDAGWAMLLDEQGRRLWSYASAHTGLARMVSPSSLPDGRFSLVLTDEEGQRGEWILLDAQGSADARIVLSSLISQEMADDEVLGYVLCRQEPPALTMFLGEENRMDTLTIEEDGRVIQGVPFAAVRAGCAVSDGLGGLAWVGTEAGALSVTWLKEETPQQKQIVPADIAVRSISDALMQDDGSVVCCGETEDEKGFLARVSREGEMLFALALEDAQRFVCQTENGFAAYGEGKNGASVVFVDEDGGLLDTLQDVPEQALDLAGMPGGAALLTHVSGHRQKQAVITPVVMRAASVETLQNAELAGQEETGSADAGGETKSSMTAHQLATADGYLLCGQRDGFGVQVTCMDGSGVQRWSTRIPIHTAADALEWICAVQLEDGGVLLGGRYLTGTGDDAAQQGVIAMLSADGVLRRIETLDGAGAVCALSLHPDGSATLHVSRSAAAELEPDAEMKYRP